ncbi:Ig-like domain-containing protein [Streptomyces avidinii]|uniref:Ig-like domain-containing protein n=1 Tax=Streptomyces avidinii TaxID=1895 RepID=UPI0037BD5E0A
MSGRNRDPSIARHVGQFGGWLEGQSGGQGGGPEGSGLAGGGGTRSAHGAGGPRNNTVGAPGGAGSDIDQYGSQANPGSGGSGGNGGGGGNGGDGGYFAGGGGSGGGRPGDLAGAGGGGGSSYAAPSATGVTLSQGVNRGNGKTVVAFRYGAALAVAADTATPLFGHAVTLAATATSVNPAAGTPGGTVTFFDGTTPLATVPLDAGRPQLRTGAFQPGEHWITATYSGDASHTPGATAAPSGVTVGFSQPCITTARVGALTVRAGQALCFGSGGSQTGPVTVAPGGSLALSGARVTGPVSADGALAVSVCGSHLTGPVSVTGTAGYVLIGSQDGAAGCAGNTIQGPLSLVGNTGGLHASANTVTGVLRCEGNEPEPVQTGTVVTGPERASAARPGNDRQRAAARRGTRDRRPGCLTASSGTVRYRRAIREPGPLDSEGACSAIESDSPSVSHR